MRELLKFEYYRIIKSKVIWLMVAFAALAPILAAVALSFILNTLEPDLLEEITLPFGDKVVGVVLNRDGSVQDVIRNIKD